MKRQLSIFLMIPILVIIVGAGWRSTEPEAPAIQTQEMSAEAALLRSQSERMIAELKLKTNSTPILQARQIAVGEEITVHVWLRDRITRFSGFPLQRIVPESGQIFIPGIGLTNVVGRTDDELGAALTEHFARILADPTVVVEHKSSLAFAGRNASTAGATGTASVAKTTVAAGTVETTGAVSRITVMGWVAHPDVYILGSGWTIRDAIAHAGGMREFAKKRKVFLVRGNVDTPQVIKVDMQEIMVGENLKQNLPLLPNDAIYVPPVAMWVSYDVIRTILLPITAVRDAVWVSATTGIR